MLLFILTIKSVALVIQAVLTGHVTSVEFLLLILIAVNIIMGMQKELATQCAMGLPALIGKNIKLKIRR